MSDVSNKRQSNVRVFKPERFGTDRLIRLTIRDMKIKLYTRPNLTLKLGLISSIPNANTGEMFTPSIPK